jgi:hypothetical protein
MGCLSTLQKLLISVKEWERHGVFVAKIVHFNKGMGKTQGVWCKRIQRLIRSELKRIKISSLKSLIITSWLLEWKEVL